MGGSDRTAAMDFFNNSDEGKMARNLGLSVEDLQEVFDQFDTDGSGGIDSKEFGTLLASLDIVWDDAKIGTTVKEIDTDENGLIDFKEFITWFLNGGADMDGRVRVCDDGMEYGTPEWQALHGDYEWDYEKDDDGNYQAQDEFHAKQRQLQEEYEMKQSEQQEANWQKEQENYQKVEDNRMFKAKLMMPLYIKKITKVVEGLTDKPMDACTNSLTVQVGQPEERASVRVYANQTEDWASLNAPANTCSAAVVISTCATGTARSHWHVFRRLLLPCTHNTSSLCSTRSTNCLAACVRLACSKANLSTRTGLRLRPSMARRYFVSQSSPESTLLAAWPTLPMPIWEN